MSDKKTPSESTADPAPRGLERASGDAGSDTVQHATDAAERKGYFGVSPDPTPRENYTIGGQLAGAPVPETDADAQAQADAAGRDLAQRGPQAPEQ